MFPHLFKCTWSALSGIPNEFRNKIFLLLFLSLQDYLLPHFFEQVLSFIPATRDLCKVDMALTWNLFLTFALQWKPTLSAPAPGGFHTVNKQLLNSCTETPCNTMWVLCCECHSWLTALQHKLRWSGKKDRKRKNLPWSPPTSMVESFTFSYTRKSWK